MTVFNSQSSLQWRKDLFHLIYPNLCLICERELTIHQNHFCSFCKDDFQFTYFERYSEPTLLDQLFWGRVQIQATFSLFYFEKGKSVQPILHALKYKDKPDIGVEMGKLIGSTIKNLATFEGLEALVPVPIHPKKEFIRGYNQSEQLAIGISEKIGLPVLKNFLQRRNNAASQTKKNRFKRWENVEGQFKLKGKTSYSHIALVDDVITTGATLEAIAKEILTELPGIQISIISLALTK